MQLIFMRGPFSRPVTVSLKPLHLILVSGLLFVFLVGALTSGLLLAAKYGDEIPVIQEIALARQLEAQGSGSPYSTPLDAMSIRLAEMRAQLARLDAVSTRLLKSNGLESPVAMNEQPGLGGLRQQDEKSLSLREVKVAMKEISSQIEKKADMFSILDVDLQSARLKFQTIPNESPLISTIPVSNFGTRIDPITGRRSQHEGIDFIAPIGTPIQAAAAGVVINASYHPGYGNLVEIEHNNKTTTRYAHASKILVKEGDIVRLGQKIALVGNTGRSTGPHLHFEVRVDGVAKDPAEFLEKAGAPRPGPGTVAAMTRLLADNAQPSLE